jgi:hypothetical protein
VLGAIIPAAGIALVLIYGIVRWIRLAARNRRTIDVPAGELNELFRGGVMGRHILTSGSLARLELFDWGVRLRGIAIARWIVPTWEASYDQLAMAELVTLPASRIAVWLRPTGGGSGIGFLSHHSEEILDLLKARDVPVNRVVTQIRRVEELYRA